jgi:flagellar FliL protein
VCVHHSLFNPLSEQHMAKDPKSAESADEAPAKSNKKLIIIIIAVVVLLVGGAGAWFFMQGGDAEHGEGEHAEVEEEHAELPPVFVPLEIFTVNLQPDPDERFLQLEMSLQVATAEEEAKITGHMPAVRNRILMLLGSKEAGEILDTEGKQALIEEIIESVNEPFSEKGKPQEVTGVFFTSYVIQ